MNIILLSLLLSISSSEGFSVENTDSPGYISLYPNSAVVNLYDDNITEIYNSGTMWLLQFYNHWCGHCQRFAPIWRDIARDVEDWSPHVRVGAINCADQSCDRYQIQGTPTTRIFHPNTPVNKMNSAYYGFDIPVKNDKEYYIKYILYNIGVVESNGGSFTVKLRYESLVPGRSSAELQKMFESESERVKYIVLLFEEDGLNVGKKMALDMSSYNDIIIIKRVRIMDAPESWSKGVPTKMVVVGRDGDILREVDGWGNSQDRSRFTSILESFVSGNDGVTVSPVVMVSDDTMSTHPMVTNLNEIQVTRKDLVFQSDLEKAVQYSLMTEVANQSFLDQSKMKALAQYIETLLNFFPHIKPELKSFLLSLLEWSLSIRYIKTSDYKLKLEELSAQYEPFKDTPLSWAEGGCAGSVPEKRGYPCSMWTLFHTLMANSLDKDRWSFGYGSSVAKTMISYITNFFSCRDCAQNFQVHVASSFYRFEYPEESMLWLWSIHNSANRDLARDPTEDPAAPKIQWPSHKNCPRCRANGFGWNHHKMINGELWNETEVLKYLSYVYHPNKIVQEDKIKKVLDKLKEKLGETGDSIAFKEAHEKLSNYCQRV